MEYRKGLDNAIGAENLNLFLKEIDKNGTGPKVKNIGLLMGGTVNTVFNERIRKGLELIDVMKYMLDHWYVEFIFKPAIDGRAELVKILENEDVKLEHLALKMKPLKMKPGILTIGLPETHYHIPVVQKPSNVTGTQAFASNQSCLTCASESVAKAAVEILDDFGFDCDQQQVIDALVAKVQPTGEAKNPCEFKGKRIKVHVTEKNDKAQKGEIEIELEVGTQWGVFDNSNHTVSTIPVDLDLKGKNAKMVVRWDIGITLINKNIPPGGPHAIFAKDYDIASGNYSCINSWDKEYPALSYPMIHNSRIYAVDYISIIQSSFRL